MLRQLTAIRYVTPLREGGSLPAIVEADDGGLYVMKFVGAGQGPKALIAEVVAGELARSLGFAVPEQVLMTLDPAIGRTEGDPEIRDLLAASAGINLAMHFLPEAFAFNPLLRPGPDPDLASRIVWFDAFVTNVDRTPRNVNLLLWEEGLWLIDHGACLYFHHSWDDYLARSRTPFPLIVDHALLPFASALPAADAALRPRLTPALIRQVISWAPDAWLLVDAPFADVAAHRAAYEAYLLGRLAAAPVFMEEAVNAHARLR